MAGILPRSTSLRQGRKVLIIVAFGFAVAHFVYFYIAPIPPRHLRRPEQNEIVPNTTVHNSQLPVHTEPLKATLHPQIPATESNIKQNEVRQGWLKDIDWKPGSKLDIHEFTVNPANACKVDEDKLILLILVKSAPSHRALRDAARKTYIQGAEDHQLSVKVLFILGRPSLESQQAGIEDEARINGDILQADFKDHYYNLTHKLISGFKWIVTYCNNTDFIMSMDDDVMLDIVTLVNDLQSVSSADRSQFVLARRGAGFKPHRHTISKWYVPKEFYPQDNYPPFPFGHGYVLSRQVVEKVFMESKKTPTRIPFDDVYCGILLNKLGIPIIDRVPWYKSRHAGKQRYDYLWLELTDLKMKSTWKSIGS